MVVKAKAVSGGSVRAWGASNGVSPPATPLRSPSCTEFGSSGGSGLLFGSTGSSLGLVGSRGSTTTAPCSAVRSTPGPASPQRDSVSPPKTAPSSTSRPKSQSLLATPEPQPSRGNKRPSVAQIMTLTHPAPEDDKKQEQPEQQKRVDLAAPVVCGAPVLTGHSMRQQSDSGGPIRRRNRPASRTATAVKPTSSQPVEQRRQTSPSPLTPPRLLADGLDTGGTSSAREMKVRQAPAAHSKVSPAPRVVRGDVPLERNTHDVILTGPHAGTKATHCREYTESGVGLDYIPPKYGTSDWEDIATLQGKTRREAEFARRQREKARNDRMERFEQDRQGFVATLEAENDARVEAARQRQLQQYKKWDRDVFQRIQHQVMRAVDSIDQKELEHRLRRQSEEYVESINQNGGWVFLEPSGHRERQRIEDAQRGRSGKGTRSGGVRYNSNDLVDPLKDEQNRLLDERATEQQLERHALATVGSTGRWSLKHALQGVGVTDSPAISGSEHLDRALTAYTRPAHWELDYELGSKVGGGAMGGRRECLPRWDSGSKPLHEWSVDSTTAGDERTACEEVRLSANARARDGAASVGRWAVPDYVGARMEMLGKEVATTSSTSIAKRPIGKQQKVSASILPDHYNAAPASAATLRQEHVAVNGRGKKLGPYGPLGGPAPPGRPPSPPNILV